MPRRVKKRRKIEVCRSQYIRFLSPFLCKFSAVELALCHSHCWHYHHCTLCYTADTILSRSRKERKEGGRSTGITSSLTWRLTVAIWSCYRWQRCGRRDRRRVQRRARKIRGHLSTTFYFVCTQDPFHGYDSSLKGQFIFNLFLIPWLTFKPYFDIAFQSLYQRKHSVIKWDVL